MVQQPFNPQKVTEIDFMLPGRVYRSPMPFRPGDERGDVFNQFKSKGMQAVVVLVAKDEFQSYTGKDLIQLYQDQGWKVIHFPIPDYGTPPSLQALDLALASFLDAARDGLNVAVHCNAGIGRTGTFLACAACRHFGMSGEEAVIWIRQFVPSACEVPEQVAYVESYAKRQAGKTTQSSSGIGIEEI